MTALAALATLATMTTLATLATLAAVFAIRETLGDISHEIRSCPTYHWSRSPTKNWRSRIILTLGY
jgi:hypothetical protein